MDLNLNDFSNIEDYQTYDDNQSFQYDTNSQNNQIEIPTFSELISNTHNYNNFEIFGDSNCLSQIPTQEFVDPTPSSSRKKSKKPPSFTPTQTNKGETHGWREKEDEALMSAWCLVSTNSVTGKNSTTDIRWNKIMALYEEAQKENPTQLSCRTVDALKNRWKRLNLTVNKWVGCYKQILQRPRASGTNMEDDVEAAKELYRKCNNKHEFMDFKIWHNVMRDNPK